MSWHIFDNTLTLNGSLYSIHWLYSYSSCMEKIIITVSKPDYRAHHHSFFALFFFNFCVRKQWILAELGQFSTDYWETLDSCNHKLMPVLLTNDPREYKVKKLLSESHLLSDILAYRTTNQLSYLQICYSMSAQEIKKFFSMISQDFGHSGPLTDH